MITNIEKLKKSKQTNKKNKKLLELISEFSKVTRYHVNIQESIVFIYTNNKKLKKNLI